MITESFCPLGVPDRLFSGSRVYVNLFIGPGQARSCRGAAVRCGTLNRA